VSHCQLSRLRQVTTSIRFACASSDPKTCSRQCHRVGNRTPRSPGQCTFVGQNAVRYQEYYGYTPHSDIDKLSERDRNGSRQRAIASLI
jgi:hypothetical protein